MTTIDLPRVVGKASLQGNIMMRMESLSHSIQGIRIAVHMTKSEITPGPLLRVLLVLMMSIFFLAPHISHGQNMQWEQVTAQGNEAQMAGDVYAAETHFRKALEIARRFPAQDLRRATSQRNLAQALALQGNHTEADTLYRTAIGIALLTLDDTHSFVVSLRDELAQIKQAQLGDEPAEAEPLTSERSLAEFLFRLEKWLSMNSTLHLGASLPLIGDLFQTNEQGFYYGLGFRLLQFSLGPLSNELWLEFNSSNLPPKHALDEPLKLEGPAAVFTPAIGPFTLCVGAGYSNAYTSHERHSQLTLLGGAGFEIWKKRRGGQTRLKTVLNLRATQLTKPVANLADAPTFFQATLTLAPK